MIERPYHPTDLVSVIETYTASIQTLAAAYYSPEQVAAWAPVPADVSRWQERMAQLHTVIAESDEVLAGFASYTNAGYLDFLFTHPAFARRGVAARLYRGVESAMRVLGVQRVITHASLAARPFLDGQGFQVDSEECVERRGVYLRRFAMHKLLDDERIGQNILI